MYIKVFICPECEKETKEISKFSMLDAIPYDWYLSNEQDFFKRNKIYFCTKCNIIHSKLLLIPWLVESIKSGIGYLLSLIIKD